MPNLLAEIDRFRAWADSYSAAPPEQRGGEWECDYDSWDSIYAAVLQFVARHPPESWSSEALCAILYAIARDNEMQHLAAQIRRQHPEFLIPITQAAIEVGERNTRWQLAEELGRLGRTGGEEEQLLLTLVRDKHEYVRRRALGALARLGSSAVEDLVLEAWQQPHPEQEWARMNCLWCLHRVGSSYLEPLLGEAEHDPRPYLRVFAERVRRGEVDS